MKNISFFLTTQQFKNRTKDVTRRIGWRDVEPGELLQGVLKGQGIPKGGTIQKLGVIQVKEARREPLNKMLEDGPYGWLECIREGFPNMEPKGFVDMFCKHNGCKPETEIARIEFGYMDEIFCLEEDDSELMPMLAMVKKCDGKARVEIPYPREWFRRMQRRKGIFSTDTETLHLIKSGNNWVDCFFLKLWKLP